MFFLTKSEENWHFRAKKWQKMIFFTFWKSIKTFGIFQQMICIHFFLEVAPFETISCIQKAEPPKDGASTRRSPHVMVFLILKVTMSCIQKAEPPKGLCLHKAEPRCYDVFNIKGHDELRMLFWRSRLLRPWVSYKRRSLQFVVTYRRRHNLQNIFIDYAFLKKNRTFWYFAQWNWKNSNFYPFAEK